MCGCVSQFSVQSLNHVQIFVAQWTAACLASLPITNSWSLLKLMSIRVADAIQPFYPLLSPSPSGFNLSQHQGLFSVSQFFPSGGQSIRVSALASFPLGWTGWISLQSKGLARVFSNTTVQKHQFFGAQVSL